MPVQVQWFQCYERCSKSIIKRQFCTWCFGGLAALSPLWSLFLPHGNSFCSSSLAPLWPWAVLKSDARAQGRFQGSLAAIFLCLLRFLLALGICFSILLPFAAEAKGREFIQRGTQEDFIHCQEETWMLLPEILSFLLQNTSHVMLLIILLAPFIWSLVHLQFYLTAFPPCLLSEPNWIKLGMRMAFCPFKITFFNLASFPRDCWGSLLSSCCISWGLTGRLIF